MTIAVVIVTYNSLRTLGQCLEAVAAQTIAPDRLIVIDNASPEGTPGEIVARCAGAEFVVNTENVGFAAANNQALELLSSDPRIEFVALLNPDAFPESTWLEAMLGAARRHPDHDAFASRMMIAGTTDLVDGLGDVYHVTGLAWRAGHGTALRRSDLLGREVFGVCAGAGFYRRSVLVEMMGLTRGCFVISKTLTCPFACSDAAGVAGTFLKRWSGMSAEPAAAIRSSRSTMATETWFSSISKTCRLVYSCSCFRHTFL